MSASELKIASRGVNDFSNPIAGTTEWINLQNISLEETPALTADVSLISTEEFKATSRILLSQRHHFNLPDGITSFDEIEMNWRIESQSDTTRYFLVLFTGGYGTVSTVNVAGASGPFFLTYLGTPSALGHASINQSLIEQNNFGAGLVVHDAQRKSPIIKVDSVKIKVTFTGAALTYNESDDFFFANSSGLVSGKAKATPYFINLPGETDGGGLSDGSIIITTPVQSFIPSSGILVAPNAEVNPHFIDAIGGALLGGIGHQTYNEIATGGIVVAPNSLKGMVDFPSGGAFVGGLGDTKFDFITSEGGMRVGGIGIATPHFIDLPGETDGGVRISGNGRLTYDEEMIGGIIAAPGHFFSFPELPTGGGVLAGPGTANPNPHFETGEGGITLTAIAPVEISWIGLPPFSLYQGAALVGGTNDARATINLVGEGGITAGGHAPEIHDDIVVTGGTLAGGRDNHNIMPGISGGAIAGGTIGLQPITTPVIGGGIKVSGTYEFHHFTDGTGGVNIEGEIDNPIFTIANYTGDGTIVVNGAITNPTFGLTYIGDGIIVIGGDILVNNLTFIVSMNGGIGMNGTSIERATYLFNVVPTDNDLVIGGVQQTGAPVIVKSVKKPTGTVGRSLASDNIFKSDLESLLITTIPKHPILVAKGLSTTDITLNECQGAFVPPQLVNRLRGHIPSPKQEAKNRSSQLAKSGQ